MSEEDTKRVDENKRGSLRVEVGNHEDEEPKGDDIYAGAARIKRPMFGKKTIEEVGKAILGSPSVSDRIRGVPHEFDYDVYTGLYKSESLVFRGINITADHVMQPGFVIRGGSEENREFINDWVEYVGLNTMFHEAVKALMVWGNFYFEVAKSDNPDFGEIDLKPIPPSTMYVYRTETGEVIGYIQVPKTRRFRDNQPSRPFLKIRGRKDKAVDLETERKRGWKGDVRKAYAGAIPFDADEVIHLKINEMPGSEYGLSVIEPMIGSLTIYQGMRVDIGVISRRYAAPKTIWLIGTPEIPASQEMIDEFKYSMDSSNIGDDIVIPSFISFEVLGAGEMAMDMSTYLSMIRDDVYAGLSVPEILMGGDVSGTKASAQIQLESFSRRIVMLQRMLENIARKEIFPRVLGMDYPISREDWRDIPKLSFRAFETEEQRMLRSINQFKNGIMSREEARETSGLPRDVSDEGFMSVDYDIELAKATAEAKAETGTVGKSATDTTRGPTQKTGGGGDDKSKAEKPAGETPKQQGG